MRLNILLFLFFFSVVVMAQETGPANSVIRVPSGGGRASAGSIDLSTSAAVGSSVLSMTNGGSNKALTAVNGGMCYSDADSLELLAAGSSGQVLRSGGAGAPAWSTATYPATATGTGTILRADGTNWVATTATYPNTVTAPAVMVGNTNNVFSALSGSTGNRLLKTNGSAISFAQADLTTDVTGVLPIANGGSNKALTLAAGGVLWTDADSFEVSAAGTTGKALISGGTGAPTWFTPTAGSVLFAGTSGILQEDNTNFFFDDTNNRLGVGVGASENTVTISGTAYGSTISAHAEGATDLAEFSVHRHSATAGFGSHFVGVRSRGTEASETIVSSGDSLLRIDALGHDGVDYEAAANISMAVDATPGSNDMPGRITFSTTPDGSATLSERMRIDSSGNVGINDTTPDAKLEVAGSANETQLLVTANATQTADTFVIADSSGYNNVTYTPGTSNFKVWRYGAGPSFDTFASQGTAAAPTIVTNGQTVGYYRFGAYDGAAWRNGSSMAGIIDGTPGAGDIPMSLVFYTVPDGSSSSTERMRIAADGSVGIGTSGPLYPLHISDTTSSGITARIASAKSDISVSSIYNTNIPTTTTTASRTSYGLYNPVSPRVSSGVSNTGTVTGVYSEVLREKTTAANVPSADSGTLTSLVGLYSVYGHDNDDVAGSNPTTINAYGLYIYPNYQDGTITNMYDIFLDVQATGGTATNQWGIYQNNTKDNYFKGDLGINDSTPDAQVDIAGNDSAKIMFGISATSGQTANIVSIVTSAGSALFDMDADGDVGINDATPDAHLDIVGDSDEIQLRVTGNSTQTSDVLLVETNAASSLLSVTNANGTKIKGTTTNDSASAGYVGEVISSATVANTHTGGATFPATGVVGCDQSISLTAGDWDVQANIALKDNTNTPTAALELWTSSTSGNSATGRSIGENWAAAGHLSPISLGTYTGWFVQTPVHRISLSATTIYYMKCRMTYSGTAPTYLHTFRARRVR